MSYYHDVSENPLRGALKTIVGKAPPSFVKGYDTRLLTDEESLALQEWASMNSRPYWATGFGIVEAAELLVATAVENGNIPPKPAVMVMEYGVTLSDFIEDRKIRVAEKVRVLKSLRAQKLIPEPPIFKEDSPSSQSKRLKRWAKGIE
jgi:hypothetical protein